MMIQVVSNAVHNQKNIRGVSQKRKEKKGKDTHKKRDIVF